MIEIINRFAQVRAGAPVPEESAFEVKLVSFGIRCRANSDRLPFRASQLCFETIGDLFRDLALNPKDVSQLSIVRLSPEVGIGLRINQPHVDSHPIGRFSRATLQNVGYAKLVGDPGEIARLASILLCRSA